MDGEKRFTLNDLRDAVDLYREYSTGHGIEPDEAAKEAISEVIESRRLWDSLDPKDAEKRNEAGYWRQRRKVREGGKEKQHDPDEFPF